MVRLLLAGQGVEVNKTAQNGVTALCIASQQGHVEVVRLLLARQGVEVNKDARGHSALMLASQDGRVEVVRLLLGHQGVEVNQVSELGYSALIIASEDGKLEVVLREATRGEQGPTRGARSTERTSLPGPPPVLLLATCPFILLLFFAAVEWAVNLAALLVRPMVPEWRKWLPHSPS